MASTRSLKELVATLQEGVSQIDAFLATANAAQPSLSLGTDPAFQLPADLDRVRQGALDACDELRAVLQGPLPHLMGLVTKHSNFSSLQAICRFGIAQQLQPQETVSFDELARRCSLDEDILRRVLRMAIANRVFCEPIKGHVSHNAASVAIAGSPELRDYLMFVSHELLPASNRMAEAVALNPGSEEPTHAGFSLANPGAEAFFDAISQDPARLQRYAGSMKLIHRSAALNVAHFIDNLGWTDASCPALVVDVGGNHGSVCIGLLEKYPSVKCIVEDLPEVVQSAQPPAELASQLSFVAQDFFTEQKVKDADVYMFRWVLHDWPDTYAVKILRQQIPALKPGARIILNEIVLPEPGQLPPFQDQYLRGMDLNMKSLHNSKERDEEQWKQLFASADPRFRFDGIRRVPQSLLAIIEVVWQPSDQ